MEEENFAELLEDYLDGEYAAELDAKYYSDEQPSTKERKHTITSSPFSIEDTITIGKFVNEYLDIKGNCKDLYHSGLKELENKFVIGVSNDIANKNPELVKRGYLLLVMDAKHHRATYINPVFLRKLLDERKLKARIDNMERMTKEELEELKQFCNSFYDLEMLREKVKNNDEFYKVLELTNSLKKYYKLLNERIEEDEEY